MDTLVVKTESRKEIVDLTDRLNALLKSKKVEEGLCSLFLHHTTAALTTGEVGEGTDQDLLEVMEKIIPRLKFRHAHDPSHAWSHMASSLLGPALMVPIHSHALHLGTWQSVLLVELDGPKRREISVTILALTVPAAGSSPTPSRGMRGRKP
jgi:secondary thiamine-phosphate synthase enzyme